MVDDDDDDDDDVEDEEDTKVAAALGREAGAEEANRDIEGDMELRPMADLGDEDEDECDDELAAQQLSDEESVCLLELWL